MKGFLFVSLISMAMSSAAFANSTSMTVVLDPLRTVSAELNIPTLDECERDGTTIDIRTCQTPDATFTIGSGADAATINISKQTDIISRHRGHDYVETYLTGVQVIAGKEVPVSFQLRSKDGVPFRGQLILNSDQVFTLVYE